MAEFKVEDLVKVAKRENNTKRKYLYVNPLQGKHVPVSPTVSMSLFECLAKRVETRYPDEKLLVIGFAETATAIGFDIACSADNVRYCMSTTREAVPGAEYLFFTESHSHATEQRLVVSGLEEVLDKIDRIVFAEDEVTTGNTIMKLVQALSSRYPEKELKFGIASILNSMSGERLAELEQEGILCDYLQHIPMEYNADMIEDYSYEQPLNTERHDFNRGVQERCIPGKWNGRIVCGTEEVKDSICDFALKALNQMDHRSKDRKILVLGTEEFMYPAMVVGKCLEEMYPSVCVKFHATTRSPIEVSPDEGYPLHNRTPLESLYESGRNTFVYNLAEYDKVFVITDSPAVWEPGYRSLMGALEAYGNKDITLIQFGGGMS